MTADDFSQNTNGAWFDAWLHRNLSIQDMEQKDAYVVVVLLRSRLDGIGVVKEKQLVVSKY